jgi:hypothetical protein
MIPSCQAPDAAFEWIGFLVRKKRLGAAIFPAGLSAVTRNKSQKPSPGHPLKQDFPGPHARQKPRQREAFLFSNRSNRSNNEEQ